MADERYDWLDEETAEQMLRGLPVEARCDGPDALAAVLGTLREATPDPAAGELPGEAAAVEAYLAARPGALRPADGPVGAPSALFGRVLAWCRPPVRSAGRPLRAGLAVAVAGFALGGVAVAAGAGVLPTPFDGGPTGPAVSVSPMGGPSPGVTPAVPTGRPTGRARRTGPTPAGPGDRRAPRPGRRLPRTAAGRHETAPAGRRPGAPSGAAGAGHGAQLSEVDQEALVDTLCSAYTHDELNADERRRLEHAAGGEQAVRTFCADHGVTSDGEATGDASRRAEDDHGAAGPHVCRADRAPARRSRATATSAAVCPTVRSAVPTRTAAAAARKATTGRDAERAGRPGCLRREDPGTRTPAAGPRSRLRRLLLADRLHRLLRRLRRTEPRRGGGVTLFNHPAQY